MDRETVITHLQLIHTWAASARECDLQFFTAKLLEDIAQWTGDALALLKEQEEAVRCKDCAYALFKEGLVQHGHIVCTKPFTERWQVAKPNDWFCGDWKRKEVK